MNKTYFTKYLPVEGEIKEGDDYLFCGKVIKCTNILNDLSNGNDSPLEVTRQRVKLFLCSRDIEKGDKIYFPRLDKYHKFFEHIGRHIICQSINGGNTESFYKEEYFKVIGEISPDALSYVKEEQEFDLNDLALKQYSIVSDKNIIKIKGPCGHFH